MVRYLATEGGIRQFLDLGCGLPTQANVHQLAQGVVPGVRVVYVDNDPMVASHGEALLASGDQVAMVLGDLRQPAAILAHPEVGGLLDLAQPVAVLCTSTLHFIADEADPGLILAAYRDRLAPGSYLAISHAIQADELAKERREAEAVYRQASSAAARTAAGRRLAVLRRLRAGRTGVHLDSRMAAGAGNGAARQAAFHPRRRRP